ncbi:MAG: thioredoxin [Caldilineales bacterium]|nr:thioredoxin [Caldilineales bacterium]
MSSFLRNIFGSSSPEPQSDSSLDDDRAHPIHVTDADFRETILKADKLALVDLWADWCGPCHMLAPTIEALADEYDGQVVVAKLNVDENPVTAGSFNIRGIPTVLFLKNGREVDRIVGVQGYPAFVNRIEKHLEVETA